MLAKANSQQQQIEQSTESRQATLPSSQLDRSSLKALANLEKICRDLQERGEVGRLTVQGTDDSIGVINVKFSKCNDRNSLVSSEKPNQEQIDKLSQQYPNKALFALRPISKVHLTASEAGKGGVFLNGRYPMEGITAVDSLAS